ADADRHELAERMLRRARTHARSNLGQDSVANGAAIDEAVVHGCHFSKELTKRIARRRVTRGEPGLQPLLALRRRTVREGIRRHAPASIALQPVVTNRFRRGETLVDIAWLEHTVLLIRV